MSGFLDFDEAVKMLPDSDDIHTFRNPPNGMLIGADWHKEKLIVLIKKYGVQLSGDQARDLGHGLVVKDDMSYIFIETKKNV